jgi:hypothetical protein
MNLMRIPSPKGSPAAFTKIQNLFCAVILQMNFKYNKCQKQNGFFFIEVKTSLGAPQHYSRAVNRFQRQAVTRHVTRSEVKGSFE